MTTAAVPTADLQPMLEKLRAGYQANPFPSGQERKQNLRKLKDGLMARQNEFVEAVDQDFGGRSHHETVFAEIFTSANAIRDAVSNLDSWMRKRYRDVPLTLQPARTYILPQPLGVIGIISPWNYPVLLALAPLAAALAAGNRAMIKPSEFTPATSDLLKRVIGDLFPASLVSVATGGAEAGRAFASLPFDHLLFTGSTQVGRQVMRAAAENLTPVTLELGGKSPAIVAEDANLARSAADIAYGKLLNAGQTCIAPDYVLVAARQRDEFVQGLRDAARKLYPEGAGAPDYTSIVNARHVARLQSYVQEARARGLEVVPLLEGGEGNKLAPLLVMDPPDDVALMREEIFGPILPIKTYGSLQEAIGYVNSHPRPLTLYLFTRDSGVRERVLKGTISGGVCVNDTLVHVADDNIPFGGVGASGMGAYHGREGFETFSKMKPVFERTGPSAGASLRPPYGKLHRLMRRLLVR
ncbi:MAG: coniferyl aldehyde dehydrogenase [Bryobacteraceae bacterium]|nr:coniferyl aldehyde dehydrogenase [Bryobacteraceae bacterium]